jgi:hypothetical protein
LTHGIILPPRYSIGQPCDPLGKSLPLGKASGNTNGSIMQPFNRLLRKLARGAGKKVELHDVTPLSEVGVEGR